MCQNLLSGKFARLGLYFQKMCYFLKIFVFSFPQDLPRPTDIVFCDSFALESIIQITFASFEMVYMVIIGVSMDVEGH